MSSKRLDLQGIRGLAILAVLGFHFYPHLFPNGYLGVDQFFVLSGFLMCMLLSRSTNLPFFSYVSNFYTKRFRRILPLYYLLILMAMIELNTIYPVAAVKNNEKSAEKAIVFMSNRARSDEDDYFKLLSFGTDLFLHTWSLSVEIQFYFLVPFMFLLGDRLTRRFRYLYYFLLSIASFVLHSISSETYAFNSVFARIWQFLIGMVVYLKSEEENEEKTKEGYQLVENEEKEPLKGESEDVPAESGTRGFTVYLPSIVKYFCLVVTIILAFWPEDLKSVGLRPVFTVLTGILMSCSHDDQFLSNRILNYIGDVSYAMYLIHWPVFEYLTAIKKNEDVALLFACLLGCFLFAVLLHETFEKWYLHLSDSSLFVLSFCFLAAIVAAIKRDEISDVLFPMNQTALAGLSLDEAGKLNERWNRRDLEEFVVDSGTSRTPENRRWCDYQGGGGQYKIALFGNSYARNHLKMLLEECRHSAYNITVDAEKGCEPLAPSSDLCHTMDGNSVHFIESARPDYAFLLTRSINVARPFENDVVSFQNDTIYRQMRSQLNKFLPNIKKKLFILSALPRVSASATLSLVSDLKAGKTREEINKNLIKTKDGYDRARLRLAELVKECGEKCHLIDYYSLFFDEKTRQFRYFDEQGLSYFTALLHLSPHGIELVRPIYKQICANL